MDDIFTLQTLTTSDLGNDTSMVIRIAMVILLIIKSEIRHIGKFYRMKLGIR